ncbi:hypothetical protein LTS18_004562 [Coniosporium uncinatum]|uniref:Uncharacterized protein n=1 Tax=Coniosporium uncinatum TaxID=93489 RepID=A0ACC3DXU5_9PEZI|nr:hypothetical protein LTS18_004562 [Coniosporium uncinatum]
MSGGMRLDSKHHALDTADVPENSNIIIVTLKARSALETTTDRAKAAEIKAVHHLRKFLRFTFGREYDLFDLFSSGDGPSELPPYLTPNERRHWRALAARIERFAVHAKMMTRTEREGIEEELWRCVYQPAWRLGVPWNDVLSTITWYGRYDKGGCVFVGCAEYMEAVAWDSGMWYLSKKMLVDREATIRKLWPSMGWMQRWRCKHAMWKVQRRYFKNLVGKVELTESEYGYESVVKLTTARPMKDAKQYNGHWLELAQLADAEESVFTKLGAFALSNGGLATRPTLEKKMSPFDCKNARKGGVVASERSSLRHDWGGQSSMRVPYGDAPPPYSFHNVEQSAN